MLRGGNRVGLGGVGHLDLLEQELDGAHHCRPRGDEAVARVDKGPHEGEDERRACPHRHADDRDHEADEGGGSGVGVG